MRYIDPKRKPTKEEIDAINRSLIRHSARRSQADRNAMEAMNEAWQIIEKDQSKLFQIVARNIELLVKINKGPIVTAKWQSVFTCSGAGEANIATQEIPITVPGVAESSIRIVSRWDAEEGVTRISIQGENANKVLSLNPTITISFEDESSLDFSLNLEKLFFEVPFNESNIKAFTIKLGTITN